jgi:MFS superfamily sulfate permease-like transporter
LDNERAHPAGGRLSSLRHDLVAGAAIWALLTPVSIALAGLVGVAPVVGLVTVPLALVGYVLLGGSRLMVAGPDTAVAVLAGSTLALVVSNDVPAVQLAAMLALLVGVFYLGFSFLKMGWIADLIPYPVLKGLIEGLVWVTLLKQIDTLLGLDLVISSGSTWERLVELLRSLQHIHIPTALLGMISLVILASLKRYAPALPGPFVVLVASTLAVGLLGLHDGLGVAVLGEIDLAGLALPISAAAFSLHTLAMLAPGALAIVVIGYTKSIGALIYATERSGEDLNPDRELRALGGSNIVAGLGGGYAVAGSLSATAVNIQVGGRSQAASITAAVLSVVVIAFFTPALATLPLTALAAIVITVLLGLSDFAYFARLWSQRRGECLLAILVLLAVLLFDIVGGLMVGTVLALFALGRHVRSPPCAVVGRTPTGAFVDVDEHSQAREIPGMLIWRQYGPLVYLNARELAGKLKGLAASRGDIRVVVIDATAAAGIDTTAANAFLAAAKSLRAQGIELWLVNPRERGWLLVVEVTKAANAPLPPKFDSLQEAVDHYERMHSASRGMQ